MTPTATTWGVVLLLAFISGLTTLVGVALGLRLGRSGSMIAVGIGFSAGVMVLVSLRELLPAAFAVLPSLRVWGAMGHGAGPIGPPGLDDHRRRPGGGGRHGGMPAGALPAAARGAGRMRRRITKVLT